MDAADRTENIHRTVAVVVRYASDLDHAINVLLTEFGFGQTMAALAEISDDTRAGAAMYLALRANTFGSIDPVEDQTTRSDN